jgi:exosome complex component RRP45
VRADARTDLETRLLRSAHLTSLDSDSFDALRFGQENGQVLVKLGQTKVITQSSLKIVTPKEGRPNEGELRFNIEFSSLAHSAEFNQQGNTLAEMRIELQNFIEKVVKSSRVTDKEGLCISQGKLVWALAVDLQLINDDGNLIDAFFLAAILALKNTRLPEVTMKGDTLSISKENTRFLQVHHLPICSTFYFIPGIDEPIVDATAKEERLATARLSICMNVYEDVCGM